VNKAYEALIDEEKRARCGGREGGREGGKERGREALRIKGRR